MDAPVMRVLSTDGVVEIGVPDPGDRSLIIVHWHSIDRVLAGDVKKSKIGDFAGKQVAGIAVDEQPAGEAASSEQQRGDAASDEQRGGEGASDDEQHGDSASDEQQDGGDASDEGQTVAFTLEADPGTIKRWGKQGDLDFEDIYVDP